MNLTLILLVLYPIYAYIIVITILYIRKVSRDKKGIEERYTEFTKIEEEFLSKLEEAKKEVREELTNEFDDIIKSNTNYQMMEKIKDYSVEDPLGLVDIYLNKRDMVQLNQYINRHFRKWAKEYHLDNPRDSIIRRYK